MKGHWRHKLKVIHQARGLTAEEKQAGVTAGCWWAVGGESSPQLGWEGAVPGQNPSPSKTLCKDHLCMRLTLAPLPPPTCHCIKQTLSAVNSKALCQLNKLDSQFADSHCAATRPVEGRGTGAGSAHRGTSASEHRRPCQPAGRGCRGTGPATMVRVLHQSRPCALFWEREQKQQRASDF